MRVRTLDMSTGTSWHSAPHRSGVASLIGTVAATWIIRLSPVSWLRQRQSRLSISSEQSTGSYHST